MEDKILDDDDIIDLTDLLEEGEPSKKSKPKKEDGAVTRSPMNEPDSFDLGKEISMEYDVSVEEIDHKGESLDIDVNLSSVEEAALGRSKVSKEDMIMDEGAPAEPEAGISDFMQDEAPPAAKAHKDIFEDVKEEPLPAFEEELPREKDLVFEDASDSVPDFDTGKESSKKEEPAVFDMQEPLSIEPEPVAMQPKDEVVIEYDRRSSGDSAVIEDVRAGIQEQIPALLESIVKPMMSELVREMIIAAREQLPGIVEKVIREEIEKLKKLD